MTLEEFQEEIEIEREWREKEINFLNNHQGSMEGDEQKLFRRSIICLIYAHIEGFVQFSFSLYINAINQKELECSAVKPAIAAAAFHTEFYALKNKEKKNPFFKKAFPDDTHLHAFSREIEFIENINEFNCHIVKIPDNFINTENNVGQQVMEKMLFKIGLDHTELKDINAPLGRLLNVRNDISHGKRKAGIDDEDYDAFLLCGKNIISKISNRLTTAFGNNEFLLLC